MEKKPKKILSENSEQINKDPSFLKTISLPLNHNENSRFKQVDNFSEDVGQNEIITPPKF